MRSFDASIPPEPLAQGAHGARRSPRIWAVAGGKGGVGKSVVATNLAVALAAPGARCLLVDADFGGANAHTLLGVSRPKRTLSHFLRGEAKSLEEVACATCAPGVRLVSGAFALLEIANLNHAQKSRFLRHVQRLEADHVVLDLGAGSSFNVLDAFLLARRRIAVVSPEPTAVENVYHFLKAAFFRWLRGVARQAPVRAVLEEVLAEARRQPLVPRELIALAAQRDTRVGRLLQERARSFAPLLIVNQADRPEHHCIGPEIAAAYREHLGGRLEHLGTLARDECVLESVRRQRPALQIFPAGAFATDLRAAIDRLHGGTTPDPDAPYASPRACEAARAMARHGLGGTPGPAQQHPAPTPATPIDRVRALQLPPLDTAHPGAYLRRCRELLGIPLPQLLEQTCIRGLERIEGERFRELPPEPYVRGQVLQYARALGIAEAEMLAESYLERYRRAALSA
ncbi:MAG: P-loop NTPase [Myxococcales bacterium]|nr:P-loop NTPase [Myxococcales bacterium]